MIEITPTLIYWISVVDSVIFVSLVMLIFSGLGLIGIRLECMDKRDAEEREEAFKRASKATKGLIVVFVSSFLLQIFVPSRDTLYSMVVIPTVLHSDFAEQTPSKVLDLLDAITEKIKKETN